MGTDKHKFIAVKYDLYILEEGEKELIESATDEVPFQFISGVGQALEAFEAHILPLSVGDTFEFTILAADAYGEMDDEHIIEVPKEVFLVDGVFDAERIAEGEAIPLQDENGNQFTGTVLSVGEESVELDMNHALAGCDLIYIGSVIESRIAEQADYEIFEEQDGCGDGCGGGCSGCSC